MNEDYYYNDYNGDDAYMGSPDMMYPYDSGYSYDGGYSVDPLSSTMGFAFFGIIAVVYIAIFFLMPFMIMAMTDAALKRKYWWLFGMIVPVVNLVAIPVYFFTEYKNKPQITYSKPEAN
jgi:hypothetical protein